jgi:hypothetical protein
MPPKRGVKMFLRTRRDFIDFGLKGGAVFENEVPFVNEEGDELPLFPSGVVALGGLYDESVLGDDEALGLEHFDGFVDGGAEVAEPIGHEVAEFVRGLGH